MACRITVTTQAKAKTQTVLCNLSDVSGLCLIVVSQCASIVHTVSSLMLFFETSETSVLAYIQDLLLRSRLSKIEQLFNRVNLHGFAKCAAMIRLFGTNLLYQNLHALSESLRNICNLEIETSGRQNRRTFSNMFARIFHRNLGAAFNT